MTFLSDNEVLTSFPSSTGEKTHQCPDMLNSVDPSGLSAQEERREYRTNDPASLTKCRKKSHGYIPPPSRSRPRIALLLFAIPEEGGQTRIIASVFSGASLRLVCHPVLYIDKIDSDSDTSSVTGRSSLPTTSSKGTFASSPDVCGQSITSNITLFAPGKDLDLGSLCGPSLQAEWMPKYKVSLSVFDVTT